MGYNIQYGNTIIKTVQETPFLRNKVKFAFVLLLLISTIFTYTVYAYKDVLLEYLLPGDAAVTASALHSLVEDVRAGEPLKDSISAFCMEILDHANFPQ